MKRLIVLVALIVSFVSTTSVQTATGASEFCQVDVERCWKGHGAEYWHWEFKKQKKQTRLALRERSYSPFYAIRLASVVYGIPYWELYNVARCETGGTFSPWIVNPSSEATGLFQFLPSTWSGSWGAAKFAAAGFKVTDPIANALGAAYVVSKDGGWGQWSCKP